MQAKRCLYPTKTSAAAAAGGAAATAAGGFGPSHKLSRADFLRTCSPNINQLVRAAPLPCTTLFSLTRGSHPMTAASPDLSSLSSLLAALNDNDRAFRPPAAAARVTPVNTPQWIGQVTSTSLCFVPSLTGDQFNARGLQGRRAAAGWHLEKKTSVYHIGLAERGRYRARYLWEKDGRGPQHLSDRWLLKMSCCIQRGPPASYFIDFVNSNQEEISNMDRSVNHVLHEMQRYKRMWADGADHKLHYNHTVRLLTTYYKAVTNLRLTHTLYHPVDIIIIILFHRQKTVHVA